MLSASSWIPKILVEFTPLPWDNMKGFKKDLQKVGNEGDDHKLCSGATLVSTMIIKCYHLQPCCN